MEASPRRSVPHKAQKALPKLETYSGWTKSRHQRSETLVTDDSKTFIITASFRGAKQISPIHSAKRLEMAALASRLNFLVGVDR